MTDLNVPASADHSVESPGPEDVAARCISACYESVLSAAPPSEALEALAGLAGASRWMLHDAYGGDAAPERILSALAQHMGLMLGPPMSWNWLPPRERGPVLPLALTDVATRLGDAAWLVAIFRLSDDLTRIIGLSADSGTPPPQELRECLNRVLHHVQRSSRLAYAVQARQAAAIAMLAHVDHSMAAIDRNRRLEFANPAFEHLLSERKIFSASGGSLAMIDPKEDRRLETALSEVIAMCAAGTGAPRAAQRTLVSNARRGGPMMIRVAPLGQRNAVANPLAVITVHPSAPTTRANSMRQTFLLTPAELRLLAVMSADATQAQLAVRLGRSVNTVKTQLSSIYEKTGTRTRAELLLMLASRAG